MELIAAFTLTEGEAAAIEAIREAGSSGLDPSQELEVNGVTVSPWFIDGNVIGLAHREGRRTDRVILLGVVGSTVRTGARCGHFHIGVADGHLFHATETGVRNFETRRALAHYTLL